MKQKIILSLLLYGCLATAGAQYRSEAPRVAFPSAIEELQHREALSGLDPARFQMNHSFSISMLSSGGQSLGLGAYTNFMNFSLTSNLLLQTSISLLKPTSTGVGSNPNVLDGRILYGASLQYRPTTHTLLEFSLQNYPAYHTSRYRPWHLLDTGIR